MKSVLELYKEINAIQSSRKMPWEVSRTTGIEQIQILGDQVYMDSGAQSSNDYVSIAEAREALQILVNEFGGTIKWQK